MLPAGGTELAISNLHKHIDINLLDGVNLIVNNVNPSSIKAGEINIFWNHLNFDQPAVQNLMDPSFISSIDHIVFVSHWQYEKFRYRFPIPEEKCSVIKNAVATIELTPKPKKIKLIYTSMPWRGLELLLDAFELLDRSDVELDIYSSTIIYGSEFHNQANATYEAIFARASEMKNVKYMGYAPNEDIRAALLNAHIFAYPCIWEETSCISAIEAAMAGLSLVTTNLGALYETLSERPSPYVCWDSNRRNTIKNYAKRLNLAIDEFWGESTQERLVAQHNYFKRFWSWDRRVSEWERFLLERRNA